jgi:hypothetical protein
MYQETVYWVAFLQEFWCHFGHIIGGPCHRNNNLSRDWPAHLKLNHCELESIR